MSAKLDVFMMTIMTVPHGAHIASEVDLRNAADENPESRGRGPSLPGTRGSSDQAELIERSCHTIVVGRIIALHERQT